MKHSFNLIALCAAALFAGACAARPGGPLKAAADSLLQPLDRIVAAITYSGARVPARKIVVYEFTDMSRRVRPEGRLVAERLTTKLVQTGKFQMIERSRLEAALKELNLHASGVIDENAALRAGRMLGAEAIVTGTMARLNNGFEINARLIDVETAGIIAGQIATLREDDLLVREEAPRPAYAAPPARPQPAPEPRSRPAAGPLPAGWEEWPGHENRYGSYSLEGGKLLYRLSGRQHDFFDHPRQDGYNPGLLLAREINGRNWTIEMKARYELRPPGGKWLSLYVWFGKEKTRPSVESPGAVLSLFSNRQGDSGYGSNDFQVAYYPGSKTSAHLSPETAFLRIRRKEDLFTVETSVDGKNFTQALSVRSPEAAAAPAQKIVLGGQAFSETGSYAEYSYIKFNGKPLF